MKRHRTIQNHYEVKIPWFHNILIEKLVLHNIVENRPVQHVTTGNNRFDYEELTIVIIEIKETDAHGAHINPTVNHLSQINVHSDVFIDITVRLTVELKHENRLVIEIMPPPYQM